MKVNEFRIGNWIYIPQTKTNEQIGSIEENGRFTTKNYKSSYSSIECLKPISLTEKWLLKLGFQEHPNDYYYLGGYKIRFDLDNDLNPIKFCFLFFDIGDWEMEIKYVHQLQNLYFALTCEELKIKEDE